jgi:hypothetical protein
MEAISKEESSQRNLEEMSLEGRRREQPARYQLNVLTNDEGVAPQPHACFGSSLQVNSPNSSNLETCGGAA